MRPMHNTDEPRALLVPSLFFSDWLLVVVIGRRTRPPPRLRICRIVVYEFAATVKQARRSSKSLSSRHCHHVVSSSRRSCIRAPRLRSCRIVASLLLFMSSLLPSNKKD